VVQKTAHAPALCYGIRDRGFIREGCFADLTLVQLNNPWEVSKNNILYKCGWSPFEGQIFKSRILKTWVNGNMVWADGKHNESVRGERLLFDRN
jgi:dihydroorotase